ncbi:MAG TPA: hypothetical protein VF422_09530 [Dokdonella sp.]
MLPAPSASPSERSASDWRDGGVETTPLGLDLPAHDVATESDADPSWKVL